MDTVKAAGRNGPTGEREVNTDCRVTMRVNYAGLRWDVRENTKPAKAPAGRPPPPPRKMLVGRPPVVLASAVPPSNFSQWSVDARA